MPVPRRRRARRYLLFVLAALPLLVAALVSVDRARYPYGAPLPGAAGDRGENGIWLRYTWYFGQYTPLEESALARRLRDNHIRYVYVHVRYVQPGGSLRYRCLDSARRLIAQLHRDAPGVRALAWVYADANPRDRTRVDPTRPDVRRRLAAEAQWLTVACGFDGVQWDYEVCPENDRGLLDLLLATRAAVPNGKMIAVATPLWAPSPFRNFGYGWGDAYLARVAALSDQIAVMDYDSGLYLPRAYVWLTAAEVRHACHAAAVGNPACRILIGLPTYVAGGPSHDPRSENIALGLRGVRAGLSGLAPEDRSTFAGIAPFADYTTTAADWGTYRAGWSADTK